MAEPHEALRQYGNTAERTAHAFERTAEILRALNTNVGEAQYALRRIAYNGKAAALRDAQVIDQLGHKTGILAGWSR